MVRIIEPRIEEIDSPELTLSYRIEAALSSSAILEVFWQQIDRLKTVEKKSKGLTNTILKGCIQELTALGNILDDQKVPFDILKEQFSVNTRTSNYSSEIQESGLEGVILDLYLKKRRSAEEIAEYYNLSVVSVRRFLKYYDNCKPSEQMTLRKKSVFDITDQLEDLTIIIQRQLSNLEGENDEVHVQYVREMRLVLAQAAEVVDKINNYQTLQKVVESIGDVISEVIPEKRKEIYIALNKIVPGSI